MTSSSRFARFAPVALAFSLGAGCGKTDSAPPVASVSLTPGKTSVAVGSTIDLAYRFQVAPDAKLSGDYRVFVHLNREDGTMIWDDDHALPADLRTSTWKPGQVIEYTRTRFIPLFSYVGPATIEMGLFKDDERLPLSGPEAADRESPARSYKVATITLLPRSQSIQIIRLSGWHLPEFAAANPSREWQWTEKAATVSLQNPKSDATLFLEYDARPDFFGGQAQQVSIFAGSVRVGGFTASDKDATIERIPITAAQLGTGEMVQLRLEVDRTFVPAKMPNGGTDVRELGIRVFHLHIEPR
jgi:hypothetical protein